MSASHKTNAFLVFPRHNYQAIGQFLAEKGPLVISLFLLCLCYQVVDFTPCEISGSHGSESEDESLLEYSAM
jgi:hypothetical protein